MNKFFRYADLKIQGKYQGVSSELDVNTYDQKFTIEFDIIKNSYASANTSSIRVYNLNENSRNFIRKDRYEAGTFRDIVLSAGYINNALSTTGLSPAAVVFKGNVTQCWSVREGNNFISQIESFDGGEAFANSTCDDVGTFPAGTPYNVVIYRLAKSIPNINVGLLTNIPGVLQKSNSYSGNTIEAISHLTGGGVFINDGQLYILKDKETTNDVVMTINADTGLLGTPVREEQYLVFSIVFEPSLRLGQAINIQSLTNKSYNGVHKVVGIKHRGTISESVCGEAITTVEVLAIG